LEAGDPVRGGVPLGADAPAFGPGGKHLFAADAAGLRGWPLTEDGKELKAEVPSHVTGVAVSKDGVIAVGAADGVVRLFDAEKAELKKELKGHAAEVRAVAWAGERLASVDVAGKLILWDVEAGKLARTIDAHDGPILALASAPSGRLIATGAIDGSLRLWDAASGGRLGQMPARPGSPVWCLAFNPDGTALASGEGRELRRYATATPVTMLRVASNRAAIVDTGKGFGLLVSWLSSARVIRFTVPGHELDGVYTLDRTVWRLLYDPKGEKVYAFRSATTPSAGPHPRGKGVSVLVYPLDRFAAGAKAAGKALEPERTFKLDGTVCCPLLSPDGSTIHYLDPSARQVVTMNTSGGERKVIKLGDWEAFALALSPDGKTLCALADGPGGNSRLLHLDAEGLKVASALDVGQEAYDLALLADRRVAIAGRDRLVVAGLSTPDRPTRKADAAGVRHDVRAAADGRLAVFCPHRAGELVLHVWPLGKPGGRLTVSAKTRKPMGGDFAISADGSRIILRSGDVVNVPERWLPRK
jgi:hypothetical protein